MEKRKPGVFTDKELKNLKPESKEYWRREGQGFSVRVLPSGEKLWYFIYTFDGRKRFMKLGDDNYPTVSIASARKLFEAAKKKVGEGVDPLEEKQQVATTRRDAHTVSSLIDDYIEKCAKVKRAKSWQEDKRILDKDVRPAWDSRKAKDVTRRDVMQLVDGMQGRGNGIITNTFKVIRRMFAYAVKKELIPVTPCYSFDKGEELPRMVSRERTLDEMEIKALWNGLDKAAMSEDIQRILKLILLTGQRSGEVAAMHRDEISGKWWEFTPKETKITSEIPRKQRVYLTDTALSLIGEGEGYVFKCLAKITPNEDGTLPPPRHITERAISHAVRRNLLDYKPKKQAVVKPSRSKSKRKTLFVVPDDKKINIAHYVPHDLRRTCATFLSQIGFSDATVDAVLAHLKKGEIRTYNKNKYDHEKQAALTKWEEKLTSIITEKQQQDNIIQLKGRKRA